MITRDIVLTVLDDQAKSDSRCILYRGDGNIIFHFNIKDGRYKYKSEPLLLSLMGDTPTKANATLKAPDGAKLYKTPLTTVENYIVKVAITKDLVDEITEVGTYQLQIHLYDGQKNRVSLPPIDFEVKEPIGDLPNVEDMATVGEAIVGEALVADGKAIALSYVKNTWSYGDIITDTKLNNIETGIENNSNAVATLDTEKYDDVSITGDGSQGYNINFSAKGTQRKSIKLPSGLDGKEIELQKSASHIQWRYVGEELWKDLVPLVDLKGEQGIQGLQGKQGIQGVAGEPGPKGDKGEPGLQGAKGEQGIQGIPGPTGARGETGPVGAKGEKGENGATFKPNVDAAGNLSWTNDKSLPNPPTVNIKGAKGETGAKGEQGIPGQQGLQGERGLQGVAGPKGDRGEQGLPGAKGDRGDNGITFTPSVNSNGDLTWTNNGGLDNPPLVNIKGARGEAGPQGQQGLRGEAGPKGEQGLQGIQGIQGLKGDTGAKGDKGDRGVTFTPHVASNGDLTWTNDGNLSNPPMVNIKGEKGEPGTGGSASEKVEVKLVKANTAGQAEIPEVGKYFMVEEPYEGITDNVLHINLPTISKVPEADYAKEVHVFYGHMTDGLAVEVMPDFWQGDLPSAMNLGNLYEFIFTNVGGTWFGGMVEYTAMGSLVPMSNR